jgi:RNA polymerase sigma-70 factor (ECF subfamily)
MDKLQILSCEQLVSLIVKGNTQAETQMIVRYANILMNVLRKACADEDLAKDISQETWRIVIEKVRANQIRDAAKLLQFIISIGKNQLVMHYRRPENKRTTSNACNQIQKELNAASIENAYYDPEKTILCESMNQELRELICQLSKKRDQELMLRFYLQEQDKKDICIALDLQTTHFDRVIYRAKRRLKNAYLTQLEMT